MKTASTFGALRSIRALLLAGVLSTGIALVASAGESKAVSDCLAAAAKGDHDETITLCSKAIEAEPENEKVRAALETARGAADRDVASPPASDM